MNRNSGRASGRNTRPSNGGRNGGGRINAPGWGRGRGGRLPTVSAATRRTTNHAVDRTTALHALTAAAAAVAAAVTAAPPRVVTEMLDPLLEEEMFDAANKTMFPGPADSEDEDDDDFEADNLDRMLHADDNMAAIREDEFIESSTARRPAQYHLHGSPDGWKPPTAPDDWQPPEIDPATNEPEFEDVDNPGNWSPFTFRPKFKKAGGRGAKKQYLYHAMPTGATPVPIDADAGERTLGDWTFHYGGWHRDLEKEEDPTHPLHGLPIFRSGAFHDNMLFPDCRKGNLSASILKHRLGMSAEHMKDKEGFPDDALFFYQLLLPMCDTALNDNDPRKSFYFDVSRFSNTYAMGELGLGTEYGHHFKPVLIPELLRWDGVVVQKDGVRGGSDGAIVRRFHKSKYNTAYDALVSKAFSKHRWLEIKRVYKLCNNMSASKKGGDNYDPAYKYDLIYKVLVHNVNAITEH
jgi:hypothetical protein